MNKSQLKEFRQDTRQTQTKICAGRNNSETSVGIGSHIPGNQFGSSC